LGECFLNKRNRLYIIVFILFVAIRGIPEIQTGSLPAGWDTTNYYAPWTMAYIKHGILNQHFVAAPPMVFCLILLTNSFTNNIWFTLKLFSPVLYGFLGVSVLYFVLNYLQWGQRKSIMCLMLLMFQPTALRISWDLLKNELALAFLFLQLSLTYSSRKKNDQKTIILMTAFSLLIVLSHQYVSIIYFAILASILIDKNNTRSFKKHVAIVNIPALALFMVIFCIYIGWLQPLTSFNGETDWFFKTVHYTDLPAFSISTNYISMFGSYQGFLTMTMKLFFLQYIFALPLIPFGFWNDRCLTPFLAITFVGSFLPVLTPSFGIPDWDRWMFMLVYPFVFYSANAITKLLSAHAEGGRNGPRLGAVPKLSKSMIKKTLGLVYIAFIVVFGINYVVGNVSFFYNPILGYIPLSMSHKPLSSQEAHDIITNINWLNAQNLDHSTNASSITHSSQTENESPTCLICEYKNHGFVRVYLDERIEIVAFNKDLNTALNFARSKSYFRIFLLLTTEPFVREYKTVNEMPTYSLFMLEDAPTFKTVTIKLDGSIDPPTAPIRRNGSIYTLTSSFRTDVDGITIGLDDITLDGGGYVLQGKGTGTGIDLSERRNVTIKNIRVKSFLHGFRLFSSLSNRISGNNVTQNAVAIYAYNSSSNTIVSNTITNNWGGVYLYSRSDGNNITENLISDNFGAIYVWESSNNTVLGNHIFSNNEYGICLDRSLANSLLRNRVENNKVGVWLKPYSFGNIIFHNCFMNNTSHARVENTTSIWDEGYPSGGNYWSGYAGVDLNNDSIGDTPFLIDADNADKYPLMSYCCSNLNVQPVDQQHSLHSKLKLIPKKS